MGFEFKNAATKRGRLPSKVLSTTAALSAHCTSSFFTRLVTVPPSFCRMPRSHSFFSTV